MARRVYFCFHYIDIFRVNQVRNSWLTHRDRGSAGFYDAAEFERLQRQGDMAIKHWIREQLWNTSVTVALVGSDTWRRPYVQYEIEQSIEMGKGLLAIHLHNINSIGGPIRPGPSPFLHHAPGRWVPSYDWILHDGYNNIGTWVEAAAALAGRQ